MDEPENTAPTATIVNADQEGAVNPMSVITQLNLMLGQAHMDLAIARARIGELEAKLTLSKASEK